MKKTQTSTTAQGMATIRAVETGKPANKRICTDPLARKFVSPGYFLLERAFNAYTEWRSPGFIGFIVCRTRYIDDYLEQCLLNDTKQVVILGAGLDSRAYRFVALKGQVEVFEVDQPVTQAAKIAQVKKIFHEIPQHVIYVPIDFNQENLDKLGDFDYQRSEKTLYICEGVFTYLKPEAVEATLAWVRLNSASRSSIIFDYIYPSAFSGDHIREEVKLNQWTQRFTGEALIFAIEKEKIEEYMTGHGFIDVTNASAEDFKNLYCTGLNQHRPIADIYSIVHASVP